MQSIPEMISRAADTWGDKTALVFDQFDIRLSFDDIQATTGAIAAGFGALGLEYGDRVAFMLPNIPAFPLTWLALSRLGCVLVPLNYGYKAEDALHPLNQSETKFIVTTAERRELFASIADRLDSNPRVLVVDENPQSVTRALQDAGAPAEADLPAVPVYRETLQNIQYTSGTTGLPKGCMLSQGYWMKIAEAIAVSSFQLGEEDVILTAQPFSYIDPQWNVMATLATGARLVVLDRFSPSSFWEKVVRHDVTFFYCLGAMPTLLLAVPPTEHEKNHKLKMVSCSGIPPAGHREIEERFGVPWYEAYGSTEMGATVTITAEHHDKTVGTGCVGFADPHREVRIVDDDGRPVPRGEVGEIVIRGTGMMDGYYKNPEATAEAFKDGWYQSGDLGSEDEHGGFFLRGRKKDMIRRGGENIAAVEVEQTLQQHPSVKVAACVPFPDPIKQEEIKAFIIPMDDVGPDAVDFKDVIDFVSAKLARFKVPRYWEARGELPVTPSERIAKHLLKETGERPVGYDREDDRWYD